MWPQEQGQKVKRTTGSDGRPCVSNGYEKQRYIRARHGVTNDTEGTDVDIKGVLIWLKDLLLFWLDLIGNIFTDRKIH